MWLCVTLWCLRWHACVWYTCFLCIWKTVRPLLLSGMEHPFMRYAKIRKMLALFSLPVCTYSFVFTLSPVCVWFTIIISSWCQPFGGNEYVWMTSIVLVPLLSMYDWCTPNRKELSIFNVCREMKDYCQQLTNYHLSFTLPHAPYVFIGPPICKQIHLD